MVEHALLVFFITSVVILHKYFDLQIYANPLTHFVYS